MILAYIGPETFLPLTSAAAGAAGVALVFGKKGVRLVAGLLRLARRLVR
jgi:hypothetical protein